MTACYFVLLILTILLLSMMSINLDLLEHCLDIKPSLDATLRQLFNVGIRYLYLIRKKILSLSIGVIVNDHILNFT